MQTLSSLYRSLSIFGRHVSAPLFAVQGVCSLSEPSSVTTEMAAVKQEQQRIQLSWTSVKLQSSELFSISDIKKTSVHLVIFHIFLFFQTKTNYELLSVHSKLNISFSSVLLPVIPSRKPVGSQARPERQHSAHQSTPGINMDLE